MQAAEAFEFDAVDAALCALRQQIPQLGGECDGGQRWTQLARPAASAVVEVTGEQLTDDGVLFGSGDQPRRRIARAVGGLAQHPEGVAVHRAHQWLAHHRLAGPGRAGGEQTAGQLTADVGGQPAGREQQHRLRIPAATDIAHRGVDQPLRRALLRQVQLQRGDARCLDGVKLLAAAEILREHLGTRGCEGQ